MSDEWDWLAQQMFGNPNGDAKMDELEVQTMRGGVTNESLTNW